MATQPLSSRLEWSATTTTSSCNTFGPQARILRAFEGARLCSWYLERWSQACQHSEPALPKCTALADKDAVQVLIQKHLLHSFLKDASLLHGACTWRRVPSQDSYISHKLADVSVEHAIFALPAWWSSTSGLACAYPFPGGCKMIRHTCMHAGLGVKLVIVLGVQPQIDALLKERGHKPQHMGGYRITDEHAMLAAMQAAGSARMEVEAQLSKVCLVTITRPHCSVQAPSLPDSSGHSHTQRNPQHQDPCRRSLCR